MTVTAMKARSASLAEMIARAKALTPSIRAQAPANEALGRLNEETVSALRNGGFFDLLGPPEFGGMDLGPFDAAQVVDEIFQADGSAGWIVMAQNFQLKTLTTMDFEAVKAMYAKGVPGLGGQGAPGGTATAVEGGYRITGNWSYGSNVLHSTFVSGTCVLVEGGAPVMSPMGMPQLIRWFVPIEDVEIKGNWNTIGLKASGSVDYGVSDLFLPHKFVMTHSYGLKAKDWVKKPSTLSAIVWVFWGHIVGELGLGRRILDEIKQVATDTSKRRGRLADDVEFRSAYARAEAAYIAARCWNYDLLHELQECAAQGLETTRRQLTLLRMAMLHIQRTNADNALFAFREGGGASLREGNFQRVFRDALAAGQHLVMSRTAWGECGKDMLGDAEDMVWGPYALMPIPKAA
jgi:indole-3-acetate monooxygenase